MKKIKIGYLPFYTKLYDDGAPGRRAELEKYTHTLVDMIGSQGFDVVLADEICRLPDEFARAAAKFNADDDIVAVVTQHLAYSPSESAVDALISLKAPIIVFDTTPDYELLSVASWSERTNPNHGIHGVQEMCSMLKRRGKPYTICAGHAFHSEVVAEVCGLCRAAAAAKAFSGSRVGKVGGDFDGMIDFRISDSEYKEKIGGEIFNFTPELMNRYLDKVSEEEIDAELAVEKQIYNVLAKNEENYRLTTKTGLALRKWMDDEKLTAVTVNFLRVYEYGVPKMPFPECCKAMTRGQGYAGEGDVLTAGLVGALLSVYPDTSFVEMFCPDWEKDLILLSHWGEVNTNVCKFTPFLTDTGVGKYSKSGDSVAVGACLKAGKAVYVNLVPVDPANGKFDLILANVEMTDDGTANSAYGTSVQGWMKPEKNISEFLKDFSYAGGTHHSALVYYANIDELAAFGRFMGFNVVRI